MIRFEVERKLRSLTDLNRDKTQTEDNIAKSHRNLDMEKAGGWSAVRITRAEAKIKKLELVLGHLEEDRRLASSVAGTHGVTVYENLRDNLLALELTAAIMDGLDNLVGKLAAQVSMTVDTPLTAAAGACLILSLQAQERAGSDLLARIRLVLSEEDQAGLVNSWDDGRLLAGGKDWSLDLTPPQGGGKS